MEPRKRKCVPSIAAQKKRKLKTKIFNAIEQMQKKTKDGMDNLSIITN